MIILAENFTEEQKCLAKEMLRQLTMISEEIDEFGEVSVYGFLSKKDKDGKEILSVLFEFEYTIDEDLEPSILINY